MACKKRCVRELGKPHWLLCRSHTVPSQVGHRKAAICFWGVLSGIVLRGRESLPQGEGPDGSTQFAKETRAGHVGLDQHEQTSLRGIAIGSCNGQL